MVKRYNTELEKDGGLGLPSLTMRSSSIGSWVEYKDYAALESKIALLEVQLKLSEAAERAWESSMMQACGEDGPKSVADKFAELESKLETALRECRSAGITIDNLEAKCAALSTDNEKAMEAIKHADSAVKLAHEKFSALAAENAGLKAAHPQPFGPEMMKALEAAEKRIAELESLKAPKLTQQAPVVPDEMTPKQASRSYCGEVRGYRDGWNACRAAMLHLPEPETDNTNRQFESLSRGDK